MSQVKLGDVAVESRETYKGDKSGMPIVGLEHITPGEVTLSNWDTDTDNTFTKRFRKGDMLFGRRRAYLKKAAHAPFDGICSGDITVIRAKEDLLLPELLPFIIQNDNLFDFAVGKSAGSLSPRVKWDNLKNYTFDLPPIEEQRNLAEVLWSINDTLQAYQKLLTETDALVQAQFVEMFGDPEKNSLHLPIKTLSEIGENLDSRRIPITSGSRKRGKYPYYGASGIVDYVEGFIFDEDILLISEDGANLLARVTPIAFSVTGKVWVNNHAHIMRFRNMALQVYIEQLLNMIDISHYVTGTAQPKLNQSKLNSIPIPVPDDEKLLRYMEFINQNSKSKSTLQDAIASLQATKHCIIENTLGTGRKE